MDKFKKLFEILGSLVLLLLLSMMVGIIVGALGIDPKSSGIFAVLLSQLVFAIFTYIIISKKKSAGGAYVRNKGILKDSWKMIIIGLGAAGFGYTLLSFVISILGEDNPEVKNSIDILTTGLGADTNLQLIIQVLVVVIIAPIVEEYLFRAYVFTESKKVFSLTGAVILNGVLFALYHMNLLQGINTFFLAMVLSLIYYKRANITDNIMVHMVNNAVALLPSFIPEIAGILSIIMIVCVFIGIYLLIKICKEENGGFDIINYNNQPK